MPTAYSVKRRRRWQRDDRPDWRNPEMPCWTTCRMSDGSTQTLYVSPELRQQLAVHDFENGLRGDWRHDPTYDIKRRPAGPKSKGSVPPAARTTDRTVGEVIGQLPAANRSEGSAAQSQVPSPPTSDSSGSASQRSSVLSSVLGRLGLSRRGR